MNTLGSQALTIADKRELRQFFAWAYWIVGGLCFYWETIVIASLLRVSPQVELPLLGKCGGGEAIIFTLTLFWPILLVAHQLVHAHQSFTHRGSFSAQFPGVLGDRPIPRTVGSVRVVLFFILIVWPTFVHVVLVGRAFTQMKIVLNVGGSVYPGAEYEKWSVLGWLKVPPDPNTGRPIEGEWRWLHWRDRLEKRIADDRDNRFKLKSLNERGELEDMKLLNGSDEPIEIVIARAGPQLPATKEPTRATSRNWITAFPILQPWGFVISAVGFVVSVLWLVGRAWRKS